MERGDDELLTPNRRIHLTSVTYSITEFQHQHQYTLRVTDVNEHVLYIYRHYIRSIVRNRSPIEIKFSVYVKLWMFICLDAANIYCICIIKASPAYPVYRMEENGLEGISLWSSGRPLQCWGVERVYSGTINHCVRTRNRDVWANLLKCFQRKKERNKSKKKRLVLYKW